jgi:SAM-dependent methyltransferase
MTLWRLARITRAPTAAVVATLVSTVMFSNGIILTEAVQITTRRACLSRSAANAFGLIAILPAASVAATTVEQQCANGAMATEQSVPGAYQQPCMALAVRSIPIQHGNTVTQLEIQQQAGSSLAGSTGTVVWNSSLLLTRLLERLAVLDPTVLNDKTILELGCGTALVSLAAACLGAHSVLATDGNPDVVELATQNIDRNRYQDTVQATTLPWGLLSAMDFSETADLVLGSDLMYFSGNWPALAETMATVLKPVTGTILYLSLGHSGFNVNAELDGFLSVAAGYGLVPPTNSGGTTWTERSLTNLLLQDCVTQEELAMVQSSGGVRVVALCSKFRGRNASAHIS